MQTRQNEAGFTLIGMLIAVGIVAILGQYGQDTIRLVYTEYSDCRL